MQDYELQLSALEELRNYLLQLVDDLNNQSQIYSNRVTGMREAGLPVQVSDNYESNFLSANISLISHLVNSIIENDIPYINNNIQAVQDAWDRARSSQRY